MTFHDSQQRFLRPPWFHRGDTVLLSPHDFPFKSFGYGYHEALGTLRSFRQGVVRPYFGRRVDAVVDWALKKFGADATRISCGGSGYWAGTAALQYGLRRFGRIAYVMADRHPDPDPRQTTPQAGVRRGRLPRLIMDASWGKPDWACKAESGKSIWDEVNLPAYVRASKTPVPFASLGVGSQQITWPQQADLMAALMESRNAFMASFHWGSGTFHPLPVARGRDLPFEPRTNHPMLACWPKASQPNPRFYETNFLGRKRGYNSGGRFNTRPRWTPDDVVDTPERLELTIFSARVSYAGTEVTETKIRNAQQFKPAAGQRVVWSRIDLKTKEKTDGGEVTVNEQGLIVIPKLTFGRAPARLVVEKAK